MTFLEIFILSLALAMDAFTVGASVGTRHAASRQIFRLSFHFGLFQSLFSLGGALVGVLFIGYVQEYDHWIVLVLLTLVGAHMIYEAFKDEGAKLAKRDLTRGMALIGLSVAVSIDAFAAGIGLPAARASLPVAIPLIGLVTASATVAAMLAADRVKNRVGRGCEIAAGLVLIGLGVWTVLKHLGVV
jgi:manganese efflux pump family protein